MLLRHSLEIENTTTTKEERNIHGMVNTPEIQTKEVLETNWPTLKLLKEIMVVLLVGQTTVAL